MSGGAWVAEITPTRFGYSVRVHERDGFLEISQRWWRPSRSWAERVGRRFAAARNARDARDDQRWTVEP